MPRFTPSALRLALASTGERDYVIAARAGMSGPRLSVLASKRFQPTDAEKKALAKALRKPVSELFPESVEASL